MTKRNIPQFINEAEEAKWWFEHRSQVAEDLVTASRTGNSGEGSRSRYAKRVLQKQTSLGSGDVNLSQIPAEVIRRCEHPLVLGVTAGSNQMSIVYSINRVPTSNLGYLNVGNYSALRIPIENPLT